MAKNRFFTIMIVPEKSSDVRKWVLPAWLFKSAAIGFAFLVLLTVMMVADYWYVMNQLTENKQLRLENRKLRQQVQVFENKINTVENTLERIKTFATRLKVITNIEDRSGLLESLNSGQLPDASSNIGASSAFNTLSPAATNSDGMAPGPQASDAPAAAQKSSNLGLQGSDDTLFEQELQAEYERMSDRFRVLNTDGLFVEQLLQDQYELLADQKDFLNALPMRKPAVGYFTSGFGVRKNPVGGRVKMHEGLDIANRPGTPVRAPADGMVLHAESRPGYGQTVVLSHGYGLETHYAHLRKILVKKGDKVGRGDQIALLGNTGRSTGPHLHYEVRVHGYPVDPLTYILEN